MKEKKEKVIASKLFLEGIESKKYRVHGHDSCYNISFFTKGDNHSSTDLFRFLGYNKLTLEELGSEIKYLKNYIPKTIQLEDLREAILSCAKYTLRRLSTIQRERESL